MATSSLHPPPPATTTAARFAEERSVMLHVGALLHALTARLNGVVIRDISTMHNEVAMDAPEISLRDACDLTTMISQVVSGATNSPEHLRMVLFEAHPQLISILLSFLHAPQSAVPDTAVAEFLAAVLNCLTDIVCAACRETTDNRKTSLVDNNNKNPNTTTESAEGDHNYSSGSWVYLHNLMTRAIASESTVPALVGMLSPMLPETVQQGVAELLFALLARVDESRLATAHVPTFTALHKALGEQHSPTLRAFVAACIRELANTHADIFWSNDVLLETLIRLISLDDAPDVRALASETLETVMMLCVETGVHQQQAAAATSSHQAPSSSSPMTSVASFRYLRELSAVIVDRLESETVHECQVAVLKLTETLLDLEKKFPAVGGPYAATVANNNNHSAATMTTFAEYLLSSYADRVLVELLQPTTRIGSLSARCLRLLLQVAPYYRHAPFALASHFPSLSKLLKLCVMLASELGGHREVVTQVVRVESSLAVAFCLAHDPRCRQLLESQLAEHPHYMTQLRSSILSNLNSAALDYYDDVSIIDALGESLTAIHRVDWEVGMSGGVGSGRPTKDSIARLLDNQEAQWSATGPNPYSGTSALDHQRRYQQDVAVVPNYEDGPTVTDVERGQRQRLAFILLTYATHRTLGANANTTQQLAEGGLNEGHPYASVATVHAQQHHGGKASSTSPPMVDVSPISDLHGNSVGPVPTRSSMLRAWGAHPHKAGAVMRAAEAVRENGGSLDATYGSVAVSYHQGGGGTTPRGGGGAQQPQQQPALQNNNHTTVKPYTSRLVSASPSASRQHRHHPQQQQHATSQHVRAVVYSKFDQALKLARQFAQYFRRDSSTIVGGSGSRVPQTHVTVYETTGDGFARRVVGGTAAATSVSRHMDAISGVLNQSAAAGQGPRAPGLPSPSNTSHRVWGVDQLKEGDLFYFSVPLLEVSQSSLEQIRARAIRHLNVIKKSFVVTPQAAKARRWFLFDMATHILPGIIHSLSQLVELFVLHGEEAAKFPMVLFREQALKEEAAIAHQQALGFSSSSPALVGGAEGDGGGEGTASLHAGNVLEVLDQVRFYFSNVAKSNPSVARGASGSPRRSTYLQDLEVKIAALSAKKFDGRDAPTSDTPAAQQPLNAAATNRRSSYDASASPVRFPKSYQYDSDEDG